MPDPAAQLRSGLRAELAEYRRNLQRLREAEDSRTWRDSIRCVLGRHKAAIANHEAERCSCGAIRFLDSRRWFGGRPLRRKRWFAGAVEDAMKQIEKQVKETR